MKNKFTKACENNYIKLSNENPDLLVDWINSLELEPADLTFALEYLGNSKLPSFLIERCIYPFLEHSDSVVREGALLGITDHITCERTVEEIKRIANEDLSVAVKELATSMLQELGK